MIQGHPDNLGNLHVKCTGIPYPNKTETSRNCDSITATVSITRKWKENFASSPQKQTRLMQRISKGPKLKRMTCESQQPGDVSSSWDDIFCPGHGPNLGNMKAYALLVFPCISHLLLVCVGPNLGQSWRAMGPVAPCSAYVQLNLKPKYGPVWSLSLGPKLSSCSAPTPLYHYHIPQLRKAVP